MDVRGLRGSGRGWREPGRVGPVGDSRALCLYTRHWETHSNTLIHSHTLTRPCTRTGTCFCPPPRALCAGITEGCPVFSPLQGVAAERSPRAETSPDLQALPGSPKPQQQRRRPTDTSRGSLTCGPTAEFLQKVNSPEEFGRIFVQED